MRIIAAFLFLLLLSGCTTSAENHYYMLESAPIATPGSVKIINVVLPDYLDRPQIVARDGASMQIREFDRWGAPLDEMILDSLNMDIRAPTNKRRVRVVIDDFVLDIDHGTVLRAHWYAVTPDNKQAGTTHVFAETMPDTDDTPDAIATAMSQLLKHLAIAINQQGGG